MQGGRRKKSSKICNVEKNPGNQQEKQSTKWIPRSYSTRFGDINKENDKTRSHSQVIILQD